MALTVPPTQIAYIKSSWNYQRTRLTGFLDALSKARPQFNIYDLASEASSRLELPKDLVGKLLGY